MESPPENQNKVCRLCLTNCDNFQLIDENKKNDLDMLQLKIDLAVSEEPLMCINCADMVKKCVDFKAVRLDTHDYIVSFINDNSAKMDLKVIYLSEEKDAVDNPEDYNICGLCMGLIKSYTAISLDNEGGDNMQQTIMLEKCLPEVDLSVIKEPIICAFCQATLLNHFRFVTGCLNTEETIKKYRESLNIINEKCLLDLADVRQFTPCNILTSKEGGSTVDIIKEEKFCMDQETVTELVADKNENFMEIDDVISTSKNLFIYEEDNKTSVNEMEGKYYSEQENVIVPKNEVFIEMGDQEFLHNEGIEIKTDQEDFNRFQDGVVGSSSNHISTQENVPPLCNNSSEISVYKCEYCEFEANDKLTLDTHNLVHKDISEITVKIYQCKVCSYETKYKDSLARHSLVHKDLSQVIMYQCDSCPYQTKHKASLRKHNLTHKDSSKLTIYQCESCSYQTKRKTDLERHSLIHNDSSETVIMYKCDSCSFQTNKKRNLKRHSLVHKDFSHKCDSCLFKTKHKRCLMWHMLTHKDPLQVTMYQCEFCSYQTKQKDDISSHILTHEFPSEVIQSYPESYSFQAKYKISFEKPIAARKVPLEIKMYQCDSCSYQTKRRRDLKSHNLVHKDSSEITMYKCESCLYETKRKGDLERHSLVHMDPSEIIRYQCDFCSFQTNRKRDFEEHTLAHKKPSKIIKMYQCDYCSFNTNRKRNLERHSMAHKDSSDLIKMYHCETCSFQTTTKRNLDRHSLVHKDSSEVAMYKCESCPFQTKHKRCIRRHVLTHKDFSQMTTC